MDQQKPNKLTGLDYYIKSRESKSKISIVELKGLLVLLAENVHTVAFRYRLVGQMWQPDFMRVIHATDKGILLKNEKKNIMISLPNLSMIMQFELDGSIHSFAPNFHYDVVPD
jgi:hypothetical protein